MSGDIMDLEYRIGQKKSGEGIGIKTLAKEQQYACELQRLYKQCTPKQRRFFDRKVRIGPFALPHQGDGVWPSRTEIEQDIINIWGKKSLPLEYLRAVFGCRYA